MDRREFHGAEAAGLGQGARGEVAVTAKTGAGDGAAIMTIEFDIT